MNGIIYLVFYCIFHLTFICINIMLMTLVCKLDESYLCALLAVLL